ncbi:MAG: hypothetical protein D3903_01905 [Candidatus Electrothrix sp. GM3_4]|nr:hypothetical protein [Candidatus Electrothrix sp. GM3_4]
MEGTLNRCFRQEMGLTCRKRKNEENIMNRLKILISKKTAAVLSALVFFGIIMVMLPGYGIAEEAETEVVKAEETEELSIVDSVQENAFVLNDSVVLLKRSISLYDRYGNRTERSAFKVGDQVIVTSVEDEESGEQRIVSIRLTKSNGQKSTSPDQPTMKENQVIKKMNGVWTN